MSIDEETAQYIRTGEHDPMYASWPGDVLSRGRRGRDDLKRALIQAIEHRSAGRSSGPCIPVADLEAFTRRKVEPMVRGLFKRDEQEAVLRTLERSVVFLTPLNIEQVLLDQSWLRTAWRLANLYLESIGADLLDADAPRLAGLSAETTCFVSTAYFDDRGPFEDFLVHEAAHVFHNCKRVTVGLQETRHREWLLDIDFGKRETFAYACEAYSCIVEQAARLADRRSLAEDYAKDPRIGDDDRVEPDEVVDIVREACTSRNGWKVILSRCAPPKRRRLIAAATAAGV